MYIHRLIEEDLNKAIAKRKSVLLLGPRQTGKTTLLERLAAKRRLNLANPDTRQRYEKRPGLLIDEIRDLAESSKPPLLVVVDEVQKVPPLMDALQVLIDEKKAAFIITGSSARKLRRGTHINLLPGRVLAYRLDPFCKREYLKGSLRDRLLYGSLPAVIMEPLEEEREQALRSYVTTYLEEEVRSEALVRNLSPFSRFLELAASESRPPDIGRPFLAHGGCHRVGIRRRKLRRTFSHAALTALTRWPPLRGALAQCIDSSR